MKMVKIAKRQQCCSVCCVDLGLALSALTLLVGRQKKSIGGVKLTAWRGAGTVHGIRFERAVNDLHNCPADATATPIRMVYLSNSGLLRLSSPGKDAVLSVTGVYCLSQVNLDGGSRALDPYSASLSARVWEVYCKVVHGLGWPMGWGGSRFFSFWWVRLGTLHEKY